MFTHGDLRNVARISAMFERNPAFNRSALLSHVVAYNQLKFLVATKSSPDDIREVISYLVGVIDSFERI